MYYFTTIPDTTKNELNAKGISYEVVEDMATEPVSLDFFKDHIHIDYNLDDNLLRYYLIAARQELEAYSQLSFGVKTMRFMALEVPKEWKLMYGKVDEIITEGYTNFGDILLEGGKKVDIEYTTKDWIGSDIEIAICQRAAWMYASREDIAITEDGKPVDVEDFKKKSEKALDRYKNVTIF